MLSGYEQIYLDMLKKEPEEAKSWIMPGLRLEDKEKNRIMLIDPNRTVIDIEQPPNIGFCKDSVIQFMKSVDERIGVPQIARYGLRSTWIEKYNGSFSELLEKYKESIFAKSNLVSKSDDIGAVFDYVDGNITISITTGPMKIEQLASQFLVFQPQGVPPVFVYVAIDMGDTGASQFSIKYLSDFFDKSMSEGEKLAMEVITDLGVS